MSSYVLPTTRAAMVADELRRLIHSGELPPGSRLRQAEMAARFGTSTTPVREAFTALAREGLVTQDAHRGAIVFAPQIEDLRENYEIRTVLEPLATELAAERLDDMQLRALDGLIEKMRRTRDLSRYQDLNREFHARIYASAGRPRLAGLIESLRDASEAYLRLNAARIKDVGSDYQQQAHAEHEAIAAALRAHDAAGARRLMTEHLEHNRQQIERVLEELKLR